VKEVLAPTADALARVRALSERVLSPEEVRTALAVPLGAAEEEEARSLIRWFRRRYPTPAERLAYARRAYRRWRAAQPEAPRGEDIRRDPAEIGRRGGLRSRRALDSETARRMLRLREARRAYRRFQTRCFWSSPPDYVVVDADLQWVASRLKTYGGREGWRIGSRLCP
jgi:hypothetical protein